MNNDLISREALWQTVFSHTYSVKISDNENQVLNEVLRLIRNAPTVYPICEDKACKYRANERPQGKLAKKLKDRIEESVCKYCQMNKHCELCEISRVFQIITLTAEEQKGGAE